MDWKDELGGKIMMKEFPALRAETCSYLTDNNNEDKDENEQEIVPSNENLNLKITSTVSKQLNLREK